MIEALTYLTERVSKINPNNPKANKGCRLLYPYVDRLQEVMPSIHNTLLLQLTRNEGKARLTNLTHKIGFTFSESFGIEVYFGADLVSMGSLVIEAYLNAEGTIEVLKDPDFPGNPIRADYVVRPTFAMKDTPPQPSHTSKTPIAAVSEPRQGNGKTVIKRMSKENQEGFCELLNKPFVKAVDRLQQTGWRVNKDVLSALAQHEEQLLKKPNGIPKKEGPERRVAQRLFSHFIANQAILEKAKHMAEWDEFYQYVDLDWRGRVYYCENFFNYQGNDLARGLLQFSEGKPLGETGNFWLAVHTASSFNESYSIDEIPEWCEYDYRSFLESQGLTDISVDKMTLEDRARWTMNNMESILSNGLLGGLPDCEKPVVFLACCLEWVKIEEFGDSHAYICHLPIPIDGTNNGWQHLGAISKDEVTGDLVGLIPGEVPKDFYVTTAKRLVEIMPDFFEERQIPMKHIRKGIAKRGSMTRAYSAGASKIAENMAADLYQYGFDVKYNITPEDCEVLAKNLVKAIADVCPGPLKTMRYLQELAGHVLVSQGKKIIQWTTPAGFPVDHAYYLTDEDDIFVTIAAPKGHAHHLAPIGKPKKNKAGEIVGYTGRIHMRVLRYNEKPSLKDTASGISPNFVHSMDAAHMSLVIANWDDSFGAVHDSFSVHACDVEKLMLLTRQQFVEMYETENFFNIMRQMIVGDDEDFEDNQPELGTLDIKEVVDSDFFFA